MRKEARERLLVFSQKPLARRPQPSSPFQNCSLYKLPKPTARAIQIPSFNCRSQHSLVRCLSAHRAPKHASTRTCFTRAWRDPRGIFSSFCCTLNSFEKHFGKPCKGGLYKSSKLLLSSLLLFLLLRLAVLQTGLIALHNTALSSQKEVLHQEIPLKEAQR